MSDVDPELSSNATELEKLLHRSKPWFSQNVHRLIYGLAAVLLLTAAGIFFNRSTGDSALAVQLYEATNSSSPEALGLLADDHSATDVGAWSRLLQGNALMRRAVPQLFLDRDAAKEKIDEAAEAFENLVNRSSSVPSEVHERALIGLARVAETRWDGEDESTDVAVAAWETLLKEYPDSLLKEHAESRIADLKSAEGRLFATQFVNFKLPSTDVPATPHGGGTGASGIQMPNADLDAILRGLDSDTETPDAETPDAETPDAETPDAETPDAETPDAETPETETPETETPETETPETETPDAETPDAETPDAETPDAETPDAETPDAETPDAETPEADSQEPEALK